jgi:hypothetical protein
MNKRLGGKLGIVLCSALLGCTTYGQPSVSVGVSVPLPSVEIRAANDFYEPLTPYGRWEVVGSYGRCWIPGGVEADWRPYANGYWQLTDAGWYWVSDEPWAWATYHYGRWDLSADFSWYWVPQTRWAPAWVSWHSGGGYIGWAPLYPSGVSVLSPQAYVFVEERHFLDPVSRSTVVANSATIIKRAVINKGPATAAIAKASGRKVQAVPVQELRHKAEAAVVAKQRTPAATSEKKVQPPVRSGTETPVKNTPAARAPAQVEKPAAATREPAKPAPAVAESKPEARPVTIKEPTAQKASQQPVKPESRPQPAEKKVEQPSREQPAASEKSEPKPAEQNHENKPKE